MLSFDRVLRSPLLPGLLVTLVALAACGRGEEVAVEAPARAPAPEGRAEPMVAPPVEAQEEAGSGSELGGLHLGGRELPRTFPEQMPIPEGAEVFTTFAANQGEHHRINVGMRFDQDIRELEAFFSEALPAAGWEVTGPAEQSVRILQLDYRVEGFGYAGGISLAQLSPDRVTVTFALTTDPQ